MSDRETTEPIDRSPAVLSSFLSLACALIAVATAALISVEPFVVGTVGLCILGTGLVRGSQRWLTVGASGLLVGVVLAGLSGVTIEILLVSGCATVLAWDFGSYAIDIGRQLGREADTIRSELVHAGASTLVGTIGVTGSYLVFQSAASGQPAIALVLLIVGTIVLIPSFR